MDKDKQKLLKYLKSQKLMSLATFSKKPWICIVYYVVDNDLNLYFLSSPKGRHSKDIALNRYISCAIADSSQKVTDKKIGVQIQGIVVEVENTGNIKLVLKMWNKAIPGIGHVINFENIKNKVIESRIYKVKPKLIKFFNEKLYGSKEFKIFKF